MRGSPSSPVVFKLSSQIQEIQFWMANGLNTLIGSYFYMVTHRFSVCFLTEIELGESVV